jgi:S-methylmethionine-dependent homocysteine/selenocysteine methylase
LEAIEYLSETVNGVPGKRLRDLRRLLLDRVEDQTPAQVDLCEILQLSTEDEDVAITKILSEMQALPILLSEMGCTLKALEGREVSLETIKSLAAIANDVKQWEPVMLAGIFARTHCAGILSRDSFEEHVAKRIEAFAGIRERILASIEHYFEGDHIITPALLGMKAAMVDAHETPAVPEWIVADIT